MSNLRITRSLRSVMLRGAALGVAGFCVFGGASSGLYCSYRSYQRSQYDDLKPRIEDWVKDQDYAEAERLLATADIPPSTAADMKHYIETSKRTTQIKNHLSLHEYAKAEEAFKKYGPLLYPGVHKEINDSITAVSETTLAAKLLSNNSLEDAKKYLEYHRHGTHSMEAKTILARHALTTFVDALAIPAEFSKTLNLAKAARQPLHDIGQTASDLMPAEHLKKAVGAYLASSPIKETPADGHADLLTDGMSVRTQAAVVRRLLPEFRQRRDSLIPMGSLGTYVGLINADVVSIKIKNHVSQASVDDRIAPLKVEGSVIGTYELGEVLLRLPPNEVDRQVFLAQTDDILKCLGGVQ